MRNLPALAVLKQRIINHKVASAYYLLVAVLVAIPIVVIGRELVKYSVNTPWWDQMTFVTLMAKLHNGTLSVYDLWTQHNEHRILVPQAVELVVGKATGFNFRVPVLMNLLVAIASFGFLLSMLGRTFTNRKLMLLLTIPLAWLMFSPLQWTNWIWGFQLAFFMCVFFTILTIWLLTRRDLLTSPVVFGLTLAVAALTTYCNGNGLLIWPIGLALLLRRKANRRQLIWWVSVGLVFVGSYLFKFHRSPDSPPLLTIIREPLAVAKYTLAYLGRNLATSPDNSKYTALIMLAILAISIAVIYKKGKLDRVMDWLALTTYVILTGVLAAISRLNFGVNHGFISNSYATISVLFVLSVIALGSYAVSLWVKDFTKAKLPVYLTVFFGLGMLCILPLPAFFSNYSSGTTNLEDLGIHLRTVQNCIYTATSESDNCLLLVYPDKQAAWNYVQTLKSLKWGDFSSDANAR